MENELLKLRKSIGLNQTDFAARMGLPFRTYQDVETGRSALRPVHMRAAERAALAYAVEVGQPMLAPASIRKEALALARLLES